MKTFLIVTAVYFAISCLVGVGLPALSRFVFRHDGARDREAEGFGGHVQSVRFHKQSDAA